MISYHLIFNSGELRQILWVSNTHVSGWTYSRWTGGRGASSAEAAEIRQCHSRNQEETPTTGVAIQLKAQNFENSTFQTKTNTRRNAA